MRATTLWAPAIVLSVAAVLTVGIDTQRSMPLRAPFDSVIPREIAGFTGKDVILSEAEARVAGMDVYLMRNHEATVPGDSSRFSLYIGYYERQVRGRTIHTPKNCLPGAGWEALASQPIAIHTEEGPATVNRYILQREGQQVLVLYWYQGRGRVEANEYVVKWNLLRDAALHKRTEEALVRVVVPIYGGKEQAAFSTAREAAARVIPALWDALPS
jgi:EpsI family protein